MNAYEAKQEIRRRVREGQKFPECISGIDFSYAIQSPRKPDPPPVASEPVEEIVEWTSDPDPRSYTGLLPEPETYSDPEDWGSV
jgi:hypothetical protein